MFTTSIRKAYLFCLFIGLTGCTRCDNNAANMPVDNQPANTTTDGTMMTPVPESTSMPMSDEENLDPTSTPTNDLTPTTPQ